MTMTTDELTDLLHQLLPGWMNETVEVKEAARQFSVGNTGEYVSALSTEANRWEPSYAGDEGVYFEPSRKKDDNAGGTARGRGST